MVPHISLQLQVVQKALSEVVAPAVDSCHKVAQEQLGLSIATLHMVMDRLPYSRKLVRKELAIAITMANAVAASAPSSGLSSAIAIAEQVLNDVDAENSDIAAQKEELMGKLANLVDTLDDAESRTRISRIIIRESKAQADLYRRWCAASGFDHDPSKLPELEEVLKI
jgi:hypothetical protein